MRPTPYVASLRIYEPIKAFEPAEQLRWAGISAEEATDSEEQERALRRMIVIEPPALKPDGAHILDIDGRRYVSPWSTATRCWSALGDFKESMPLPVTRFFVPENMEEAITINSELMEDKVPHIISETWMIPPRWFSLFEAADRNRGQDKNGAFTLLQTSISKAKERCLFSHQTVVSSFGVGPIEQEIADLLEWLNLFHAESLVELDYGGLAEYLAQLLIADGESGIDADTSVEDLHLSLAGLASGDGAMAGQGYERLITRWRRVAAMESAT
ncbi:MAG: hypothetical protein WCK62_05195 [Actinomycetes bacterium]